MVGWSEGKETAYGCQDSLSRIKKTLKYKLQCLGGNITRSAILIDYLLRENLDLL